MTAMHTLSLLAPRTVGRLVSAFVGERGAVAHVLPAEGAPPPRTLDEIDHSLRYALRAHETVHALRMAREAGLVAMGMRK